MCSVTKMPQAAFTSWLGISWEISYKCECWGNRVMLRRQFCLYWGLRADGAWETDSVVMETELILREDVCGLIGGFMECFGQEGATVCMIWEAACLGRYGNQNLADWLLVELMFKRHLRDRHIHTQMIEFRAGWPNLSVSETGEGHKEVILHIHTEQTLKLIRAQPDKEQPISTRH